jgi:nitrate/nitrite-specific signal transduction histidine kinase
MSSVRKRKKPRNAARRSSKRWRAAATAGRSGKNPRSGGAPEPIVGIDGRGEKLQATNDDLTTSKEGLQELLHTLHDALGQTLTGLGMLSAGLRQRLTGVNEEAADTAREIAKQAQQALEQVRQLSRSLFPAEVGVASLTSALQELAFATQSLHKIQVRVHGRVPAAFSNGAAATQLYRIVQEAVANAVKHAQARSIAIQIDRQGVMLRLRIADDGVGIGKAAAGGGIGLKIMRYRAHSIGGILAVEPGARGGTVVTCALRTVAVRRGASDARRGSTTRVGRE